MSEMSKWFSFIQWRKCYFA